jgi:acyl carrier protein
LIAVSDSASLNLKRDWNAKTGKRIKHLGEANRSCPSGAKHRLQSRFTWRREEIFGMDEPQIYTRLTQIFEDVFDEDSIQVTPELSAKDVDGWDSLAHIRLILTIERAFKIKFSTSEIGKLQNVGELVTLIKARAE